MLQKNTPVLEPNFVNAYYIQDVVKMLSYPRPLGSAANERAALDIMQEFTVLEYEPRLEGRLKNIVVGDVTKAKYLIGSHYDTVPNTPGADDNASAVAVMLSIASQIDYDKRDDICFVSFNGEENGLLGSSEFVELLPNDHKLEQVHILEMVGYRTSEPDTQRNPLPSFYKIPTVGDFIGVISNNGNVLKEILNTESPIKIVGLSVGSVPMMMLENFAPHVLRSDHAPFWRKGISAVMWTDTAEFRNANYHGPYDVWQNLDIDFMAGISKTITAIVSK